MTPQAIKELLAGTGLPVAYRAWKQPPAEPYLVYLFAFSSDLMADDHNYASVDNWQVELYAADKDPASEALVEGALRGADIPYQKSETYLDTEDLYQTIYVIRTI